MRATETPMQSNLIPLYLDQIEVNGTPSLRIWTLRHGWRRDAQHRSDDGLWADTSYDVTLKHFLQREAAIGYAQSLVAESKRADWSKDRLRSEVSELADEAPTVWRSESGNQYLVLEPTIVE